MSDLNLKPYDPLYPMRIHPYEELLKDQNASVIDKINSIIDYLNSVGKLTSDVVKNWNTVYNWVMNDGLTTGINNKLESMLAKGEFDSILNTVVTKIGDITTLTTTDKSNLTKAINELVLKIGNLSNLTTTDKTSLVNAVNEVNAELASRAKTYKKLYTFKDAFNEWRNGSKFPIGFFGDSTIDGVNTTGWVANSLGVDSVSPNAFSKKLENKLRDITGNSTLRIYNAGFSGQKAYWGATILNDEFGATSTYSDVKMVGIGFGINDRLDYPNVKAYKDGFRASIIQMIDWFYSKGIQPFLLTTQAIVSPDVETQYTSSYPLRTAEKINSIANEVKRELSIEYNLELIDINKYTHDFLKYSSYHVNDLISDRLHFGDVGHEYEAGLIFSHFCPYVTLIENETKKIDFSNQNLAVGIPEDKLSINFVEEPFKVYAYYDKGEPSDKKIMDTYIFVNSKKKMDLFVGIFSRTGSYVKVNNVQYTLDVNLSKIQTLDLGLYRLEAYSGGKSNVVDFKGFLMEQQLDDKIQPFKLGISKNLFNKKRIIPGNIPSSTDGTPIAAGGQYGSASYYVTSEFIPVSANTQYFCSKVYRIAYYDTNKIFISYTDGIDNDLPFTTPANTAYVRIGVLNTNLDTCQLELGGVKTSYKSYYVLSSDYIL